MRITTQMLNESARKTGLPVNSTSLLNYINNDSDNNSLLSALNNKKNTSVVDTDNKKKYEKLGEEADKLAHVAATLLQEGEGNLFAQAKENVDLQKIYDTIESLFDKYNSTMKSLKNTSGTLNEFYRKMLSEASKEVKESLASIGISLDKDGMASVDRDKIKETDLEALEKFFGSKSEFVSKLSFISTRISDNAEVNVESFKTSYSNDGNLYYGSIGSKYNYWG